MNLNKIIKEKSDTYFDEMVRHRRHLHQFPELSYKEFETTKYIEETLKALNILIEKPLETGCVGILEGGKKSDKVIALRADIDALPIVEEGPAKKEFISQNEGVAHCCGHDVHTANLLGSAQILSDIRDEIEGTVLLVFQPAEEKLPGGGRLLCETGFLQKHNVQAIYGLHTNPNYRAGQIAVRKGPFMARPDEFEIEIIGVGGHAAAPHEAVDPILIASHLITAIQSIISRNIDPNEPAVVTVGRLEGGSAHNIIPEKVQIWGTIRSFSAETSALISNRIEELAHSISQGMGGGCEYVLNQGYPAVINTDWCVDTLKKAGTHVMEKDAIIDLETPIMAGEDFAFYQQYFPGTFFFLGSGSEEAEAVYPWHHPRYNADEQCLKTGAAMLSSVALQPVANSSS